MGTVLQRDAPLDQESKAIPVESYLLQEVRSLSALLAGVEVVVDCEPPGVALIPARARRLVRCSRHLMKSVLRAGGVREIDLTVRADARSGSPMIFLSVRAIGNEADPGVSGPARDAASHRRQRLTHDSKRAMLLSRRDGGEQRLTLALELPFEILPDPQSPAPPGSRVLVADDNSRVRRVARRMLERRGFEVAEAPGAIALLAELDPHRPSARPDWLLVDEGWLRPADARGRGLMSAVEAAMPADRVVVLSNRTSVAATRHPRVAKPFGGAELQFSLVAMSPERKLEAEVPYSLSL
jgi:CheY-like chemotaxis protein